MIVVQGGRDLRVTFSIPEKNSGRAVPGGKNFSAQVITELEISEKLTVKKVLLVEDLE